MILIQYSPIGNINIAFGHVETHFHATRNWVFACLLEEIGTANKKMHRIIFSSRLFVWAKMGIKKLEIGKKQTGNYKISFFCSPIPESSSRTTSKDEIGQLKTRAPSTLKSHHNLHIRRNSCSDFFPSRIHIFQRIHIEILQCSMDIKKSWIYMY